MCAELERRWPCHGGHRDELPLFCDDTGEPFTDSRFASLVMGALTAVLGPARATLYSPHSWRVWLASALRKCGATDPMIMAFGRWLNQESVKIYARLTTEEYAHWMNKIMSVTTIDAARTTNLPPMEIADMIREWHTELGDKEKVAPRGNIDPYDVAAELNERPHDTVLKKGTRISVFWTDMHEWFNATVTSSRLEWGDDGRPQRATHVIYDATGPWTRPRDLKHWHCLEDINWNYMDTHNS